MKKLLSITILALLIAVGVQVSQTHAAFDLTGWAWSSNIGWLSFSSANPGAGTGSTYGVIAATSTPGSSIAAFSGYAWSPNIGWISFNNADVTGCPTSEALFDKTIALGGTGADLPSGVNNICVPRVDLSLGKVSGWARILSMAVEDSTAGWLHLSGTNHITGSGGVVYNPTSGAFTGFAWEPSAIGWMDFAASGPSEGVKLCVTGTPNCPPVPPGGLIVSCSSSPASPVIPGTIVTFTASVSGGTSPYTYSWVGGPYQSSNSTSVAYSADGFGPTLSAKDSASHTSSNISCPAVTVSGTPGSSSGLKLMIALSTSNLSENDYSDTGSSYKSLRVIQGSPFKLQWNIDPDTVAAGYNACVGNVIPFSGPSGSWGDIISGQKNDMQTSGIQTGAYTFRLTCSGDSVPNKSSSVKLDILNSSVEEI